MPHKPKPHHNPPLLPRPNPPPLIPNPQPLRTNRIQIPRQKSQLQPSTPILHNTHLDRHLNRDFAAANCLRDGEAVAVVGEADVEGAGFGGGGEFVDGFCFGTRG